MVTHREFIFLSTNKDSRVLTCVNKCIAHIAPRINLKVMKHCDVHYVELFLPNGRKISILNVYNNPDDHEAQQILMD